MRRDDGLPVDDVENVNANQAFSGLRIEYNRAQEMRCRFPGSKSCFGLFTDVIP